MQASHVAQGLNMLDGVRQALVAAALRISR